MKSAVEVGRKRAGLDLGNEDQAENLGQVDWDRETSVKPPAPKTLKTDRGHERERVHDKVMSGADVKTEAARGANLEEEKPKRGSSGSRAKPLRVATDSDAEQSPEDGAA